MISGSYIFRLLGRLIGMFQAVLDSTSDQEHMTRLVIMRLHKRA
jgi:hypothetical protein